MEIFYFLSDSPSLKKNIQSFENQLQEFESKEQDSKNAIKNAEKDYKNSCDKLGILGEDLYIEIPRLVSQLPEIFKEIVALFKQGAIKEALDYYYNFILYANPKVKLEVINKLIIFN